jgi:hypothetical protein
MFIRHEKFAQSPIGEAVQNTVLRAVLHNHGFNSTNVIRLIHIL